MPELPEVETTRSGIEPHLVGQAIADLVIRNGSLRWPVPDEIHDLVDQKVIAVRRRAKYLLVDFETGTLILHLGMSGSLRISSADTPLRKHDHLQFMLGSGAELRFHDPRRFGCALWSTDPEQHDLIRNLGPEPLEPEFSVEHLLAACSQRKAPIKQVIMDGKVVVGVGNIYACEALHRSGIHPKRPAQRISKARLAKLVEEIRFVLERSITQGGTTLRDFVNESGEAGYFKQQLTVYGRESEPCHTCCTPIKRLVLGQRSTFYCPKCQR